MVVATKDKPDLSKMSEMDLALTIYNLGGIAWRMNHDAIHGRISVSQADSGIKGLNNHARVYADQLQRKTGIKTDQELKVYVTNKVAEQERIWDKQWKAIYKEGAVFKLNGKGRYGSSEDLFETIRTYQPITGTGGPKEIILTRIQNSSKIRTFDDRDVPGFDLVKGVEPDYQHMGHRGLVKAEECPERRPKIELETSVKKWRDFTDSGIVFSHLGFNTIFETYGHFNLAGRVQNEKNEVIIARPWDNYSDLFEFMQKDLEAMVLLRAINPVYHAQKGFGGGLLYADLSDERMYKDGKRVK